MTLLEAKRNLPVILFQIGPTGLEFLNEGWELLPGMSPKIWLELRDGGWRKLVPVEYHAKIMKLGELSHSLGYQVLEIPVIWRGSTIWMRLMVASVHDAELGRKIVGFAQPEFSSVPGQPMPLPDGADFVSEDDRSVSQATSRPAPQPLNQLCHDISGPLTTILINCEMVLEEECPDLIRSKTETIFTEAMQINQVLREYRSE